MDNKNFDEMLKNDEKSEIIAKSIVLLKYYIFEKMQKKSFDETTNISIKCDKMIKSEIFKQKGCFYEKTTF